MSVRESPLRKAWGVDPAVLGIHRALEPPGALTHMARLLDAQTPPTEYEVALDVELLAVDATSFRAIRERCGGDAERMAETIASIVADIDVQRPQTNLSSAIRLFVLDHFRTQMARVSIADAVVSMETPRTTQNSH